MATLNLREKNGNLTLQVVGKFNFDCLADFSRLLIDREYSQVSNLTIDMGQVEYIDSAALGALVALRRKLPAEIAITIRHCNVSVREVLSLAHFENLFALD